MAVKIIVIDITGSGRVPGTVRLEGIMSRETLKREALLALGIIDFFDVYRIEVLDGSGNMTTKITSSCKIFVSEGESPFGDLFAQMFKK